ncbi:MAG: adenosylcobinamide amidohydrolase [Actinomycetota bacterium]|jgi:adenosylcobinamide hydrolase|nr:adenosylcobinamide amidohydrolase [Actinomycetota bacterium]
MQLEIRIRREAGRFLPVLLWRLPGPMRAIASSPHGGGIGVRRWVLNAQVPPSYGRRDPDHHLGKLGVSLGLPGRGVGLLTAADVRSFTTGHDEGVEVTATVGLGQLIRAAAPPELRNASVAGTINLVVALPERLSDGALVNAVATVTEAKAQALHDRGLDATGTATDAVCIFCPDDGRPHQFGGPRSLWGARLARAVHAAVVAASS